MAETNGSPPRPQQGSSSRREPSASSSSGAASRGSRTNGHPAVESAVTRLLVSIKQLLESLTKWSLLKIDENDVSDVYVRLGNDFNAAVAAFSAFGIDMSELMTVPEDLRVVLEQCLAEDATADNLALYLPTVRQIITNLLQGLRGKQSIYRRIVQDTRHRSEGSGHERTDSRSSRSSRRDTNRSQASTRTTASSSENGGRERDSLSRRSATNSSSTSSRRREPSNASEDGFVGGFSPNVLATPSVPEGELEQPNPYDTTQRQRPSPPQPPPPSESNGVTPSKADPLLSPPLVPPTVKRWSLVDKPATAAPELPVEPSSPDPVDIRLNGATSPPIDTSQAPAMASSLAALKKSDTLERRASKRFSTYNISKMTGSSAKDRLAARAGKRSSLAGSSLVPTPADLAVLTEADDEEVPSTPSPRRMDSHSRSASRPTTPAPPVPPIPSTPSRTPDPTLPSASSASQINGDYTPDVSSSHKTAGPSKFTVFLQLGREVKRSTIEPGLSMSSLRMLFVDKFSYNPGLDNFPAIYIRDPSSGVQYELEDIEEVKDKCLLSLNIEPLDQIKQHIDSQISTLSQDLKELRVAVSNSNRAPPMTMSNITAPSPIAESTPFHRPTDRQFQQVARRLSRFVGGSGATGSFSSSTAMSSPLVQQVTGQSLQPQMTGGSILSDHSTRIVSDLKSQFDEVQNLRRDLGVMRQLYTEFMKSTKVSLTTLRSQTQTVKQLANANIGGARAFIDSGKQKLDVRTQNVLTEVEKLQDNIEGLKDDVLKRHVTPKAQFIKTIKRDMDSVSAELESLRDHIQTIKPMWKKTWEEELQNIVEEQQFLSHQEEFLSDLLDDHKAVMEVHGHVSQVIGLRGTGSGKLPIRSRGNGSFKPAPPPGEETGALNSVMMEIRTAAVDPERRLKAIEANQKNRERELASRSDELQVELSDFVGQKKLRMTGGAEEAERIRQKKNDMTLKAMFTGSDAGYDGMDYGESTPTP